MTDYFDVYGKMEMAELDEEQRLYFEKVKGYLSPINTSLRNIKYFPEATMTVIEQISTQLVKKEPDEYVWRVHNSMYVSLYHNMKTYFIANSFHF